MVVVAVASKNRLVSSRVILQSCRGELKRERERGRESVYEREKKRGRERESA